MTSSKHGSGAGRALRRGAPALLAAATIVGAAACSSSASSSGSTSPSASSSASAASTAGISQFLPGTKPSGTPVKIGLINNEGSSPVAAPEVGNAAVAAADYANAELGGIAGHPIDVIRCSENEDTASATACSNEMVQDNVAAVVIGTSGLGETMVPIITKAGISYAQVTGESAEELTNPLAFSWSGGYEATLSGVAAYSKQQGFKKVVAFVVSTPSAIAGSKALGIPLFKADGVDLTIEPVPEGVPDATAQVTAGLGGGQDASVTIADEGTCTSVLKALNVVNPSLPKLVITPCFTTAAVQALGSAMNGVKVFGSSAPQANDAEGKLFQYVMATYAPSTSPSGDAVVGYQGMLGLVRATEVAGLKGTPTPASITAAIKAAENVPLPAAAGLRFTCNGKALPTLPSVCSLGEVMVTVQNGVGINPQVFG